MIKDRDTGVASTQMAHTTRASGRTTNKTGTEVCVVLSKMSTPASLKTIKSMGREPYSLRMAKHMRAAGK